MSGIRGPTVGPLMARVGRSSSPTSTDEIDKCHKARFTAPSEVELLGDAQGVINLDAEITNGAFELPVTEEELDCS